MMDNLYMFEVNYYNDYDDKEIENRGVVCAENCSEAMKKINVHILDKYIYDIKLELIQPSCGIVFLEEDESFKDIKASNCW